MKSLAAYKPYLVTAVPQTPETRLEIMKAIHALAATQEDKRLRQRSIEIASVRREFEEIARDIRKLRREWPLLIRAELRKADFNSNEPRAPAGNPDGGQWTRGGTEDVESGDDIAENLDRGTAPKTESSRNQEQDTEADVQSIVDTAKQLNAAASPDAYQQCLELCYSLLERPPGPRRDGNYWDFIRCMNACLGRNL